MLAQHRVGTGQRLSQGCLHARVGTVTDVAEHHECVASQVAGLAAGDVPPAVAREKVVVGANFLIDAESNLRAALQNFAAPQSQGKSP